MALGLGVVAPRGVSQRSGRTWLAGMVAEFIGWSLLMLRGLIPLAVSFVVGNTFLSLGLAFELDAISSFREIPISRRLLYGSVGLIGIVYAAMLMAHWSPAWFIIVTCLYNGIIASLIVAQLVRSLRIRHRSSDALAVGFFTPFVIVTILRAVHTAYTLQTTSLLSQNIVQSIFFATIYVTSIGASFTFILMLKQESDEQLIALATTDPLTGIFNRRAFFSTSEAELERCRRTSRPVCLLLMDLDKFKTVNDTYGHAAGDKLLVHFCATLRAILRPYDVFGRYGGEEFIALLPETGDREARAIAARICETVASTPLEAPLLLPYTVSIGVTIAQGNETLEQLAKAADEALYRAKAEGRNRAVVA